MNKNTLRSQPGLRGIVLPLLDQARIWVVLIVTGILVGFVGAWLDVLVACGLDAGEECNEWNTWGEYLGIRSIAATALIQSIIYVVLAILNGYVLDLFLSPWTLLVKGVGLALAVGSGLSLGKEGPLVHGNQAQKRRILSAAASAGVAVAFGSPLGGVLFGLEELDLFARVHIMWRAFVCAVLAAVTLQWTDVFATGNLVLFRVTEGTPWKGFELFPWMILSVFGGLAGALLIRLNIAAAVHRHRSWIRDWPLMEVVCVTAFTSLLSYPIAFMRAQSTNLVGNLFAECDPTKPDYHGLCKYACFINVAEYLWTRIDFWVQTGVNRMDIRNEGACRNFLPTIAIGATMGRAVGIIMQGWHRAHPTAWIFSSCAPEGQCIFPGFYSVIGAAAMLGGVTRMTISLVVIMFELTGALSHVLPIMIAVMVSKWVGDVFGKEGIYDAWIALHGYPFLSTTVEFRDYGETAAGRMIAREHIISINAHHSTSEELEHLLQTYTYRGFPVVDGDQLVGYITRDKLQMAISNLADQYPDGVAPPDMNYTFVGRHDSSYEEADLSASLDPAPMQLRPAVPLQLVVSFFQKMSPQCVLFTNKGQLKGMMTKRDVVNLLRERFQNAHVLAEQSETIFTTGA
ncbi:ClC voltage-gated chloride channel protein [Rhizoctonia solani]|uniref:Chloride channel protein n=1 Tax=Rhizoctonia solani TaxID=456999 RepID=A0A8H8NNC6_9AGAM|nr:ClC voltage-gated chloride channel protein [Rhizoctonia solani]QRW16894.1 ClC voltage-gated chloride channel protein [Rhizoctonia solani]